MSSEAKGWAVVAFFVTILAVSGFWALAWTENNGEKTQRQIAKICRETGSDYTIVGRDGDGGVVMGCKSS